MGMCVEVFKYDYEKLKTSLLEKIGTEHEESLEKILSIFGENIGGTYILLNNEFWEDNNSYYLLSEYLDEYFEIEDSHDIIRELHTEVNCNASIEDAEEQMEATQ